MNNERKKILMAAYGGGHVNLMVPVYKELCRDYDIAFLGLSIAGAVLKAEGIPYKQYIDYEDEIMDEDAYRLGEEFADLWHVDGKVDRRESVMYLGACMRDLVNIHGEEKARELVKQNGRMPLLPLWTAAKIVELENPDIIVTTNSPRTERALTMAGRENNIPTLNIHDHLGFEPRHKLESDRIAVMCDITRNNLIRTGHDPEKIIVCGQPAFDSIVAETENYDRAALCKKLGLDPEGGKYVLLGSQAQWTREMLAAVVTAVKEIEPAHKLLIKPHPGEDKELYDELKKTHPEFTLFTDISIRELIAISEIMIALWSTVGLEAVLMGKPLIQMNLPEIPNMIPLFQYGISLEISDLSETGDKINTALFDMDYRQVFQKQRLELLANLISGQGTEKVCGLIRDMLQ